MAIKNASIISSGRDDITAQSIIEHEWEWDAEDQECGFVPFCETCEKRVNFNIEIEYLGFEEDNNDDLPF